ncbi:MAG TPA: energy transducer TonB [Blastocatellia bacterium]|nr:energy transducer TonB [Blastocatellia bacterium]
MLSTLNKYIEDESAARRPALLAWYERDRRFARLLAASVVCHLIFYVVVIQLDLRSRDREPNYTGRPAELVKLIDVAPPPPSKPLRAIVEPIERADLSRMEFDPERGDDIHLVSRSPRLGSQQGAASAPGQMRKSAPSPPAEPGPPAFAPVRTNRIPPPTAPIIAQLPSVTAPPPPVPQQAVKPAAPPESDAPEPGPARGRASQGTKNLGLQVIQSQYMAYVRAKISKVNERIMPRKWIQEVLTDKVSGDFELQLGRGGRILSARLARSTGYSQLDRVAREAIYMASPFDGYPRDAGDTITLTVTVYYTPLW